MTEIDITTYKEKKEELVLRISREVDGEAKAMRRVPSKLILTKQQYNSLVHTDYMIPIYDSGVSESGIIYRNRVEVSGDQLFLTKGGYPLEVEVKL